MSNFNPYDPLRGETDPRADQSRGSLSAADLKKAEAIVKDANQFWLAILATIFCSGLGVILIVPWYSIRLIQYRNIATKYPVLLTQEPPPASLADRFQRSKWKLLTAIIVGVFMLFTFALLLVFLLMLVAITPVHVAP